MVKLIDGIIVRKGEFDIYIGDRIMRIERDDYLLLKKAMRESNILFHAELDSFVSLGDLKS